jgi:hypothetical protein
MGILFCVAGSILIFAGQRMFCIRRIAAIRGQKIEATITRWKSVRGRSSPQGHSRDRNKYCPEVVLMDSQGIERTVTLSYQFTSRFANANPTGSSLFVLVDPAKPERVLDTTWTMSYFLPALLTLCGGTVLLLGLGIILGSP